MNKTIKRIIASYLVLFLVAFYVLLGFQIKSGQTAAPVEFQTSLLLDSGINTPTGFEFAPDGRIFILELNGNVKVYKNGSLLATPFTTVPTTFNLPDRSLLGVDFDPDFATNHYVYFLYIDSTTFFHTVVRYNAENDIGTNPTIIYSSNAQAGTLHAGGTIQFGNDGMLYISIGDAGKAAPAQGLDNVYGKVMRINKDGTIPSDNPFFSTPGAKKEIWAYGFRNPFRFQFDSLTGKLYLGDVGESAWEEINIVTKGGNYGWPNVEGSCAAACPYINPIYSYFHTVPGFSVTGGPVYRGASFPEEYQGSLFFADYGASYIKRIPLDAAGLPISVEDFDPSAGSVVDMKVGPDGSLYYVTIFPTGKLYKISYTQDNQIPTVAVSADVLSGPEPLTVNFSSEGSGDPEDVTLTYLWDFGDGTTSTDPNPIKIYTERGHYSVKLKVSDGVNEAQAPLIEIQAGIPPELTINAPLDSSTYKAGDTINYSSTSAADTKLEVIFHHNTHIHPFLSDLDGESGSFVIPTFGEKASDVWYALNFTATDLDGLETKKSVSINTILSTLSFETSPPGLQVTLDGQPQPDGYSVEGVVGIERELGAPVQIVGGVGYEFDHWSDGGATVHTINTPLTDTTYTAYFRVLPAFNAEYFTNTDLSGTPALVRQDQFIDFAWHQFSPDPTIPADNFSVRWTKEQEFAFGEYEFRTSTDDGSRLYVDGDLVIDDWNQHGETARTGVVELDEGMHEIKMEYFEAGGGAIARLSWYLTSDQPTEPPQTPTEFNAEYFNNKELSGEPVLTRIKEEIDNVWYLGSPDPVVNPDEFSARWTKTAEFTAGDYNFFVTSDDGARLYIDDELVLDQWVDMSATSFLVEKTMTAGAHEIRMEYFENTGNAVARLSWVQAGSTPVEPVSFEGYKAEYFVNKNLLGSPVLVRDDEEINFDWHFGSPDPIVSEDLFSVRWTKTVSLDEGSYVFNLAGDDGVRLFINDELVLDGWKDQNFTQYAFEKYFKSGEYDLRVEYFENSGSAGVFFDYNNSDPNYKAEYFNNQNLEGEPVLVRSEENVAYLFNETSPDPEVDVGNFSARWTKSVLFEGGSHYFSFQSDDGIRFYIDDVLILDDWTAHALTHYDRTIELTPGVHELKIEYFQAGGGGAIVFNP